VQTMIEDRWQREGRPSWRFLIALLAVLSIAQIALYQESFVIKPAADDFSGPSTDIHRAEMQGPMSLFLASNQPKNYRPLQSLLAWAFARGSMPDPWFALRVLHFLSMSALGACAMMWTRVLPLRRVGVCVVGVVTYFHPAITPQLADTFGFAGLLASAFMWWGALAVYVFRQRPVYAVVVAGACLIVGGLVKEYTLGLAPLAAWTAFALPSRSRMALTAWIVLAMGACGAALMIVRRYTVLPGEVTQNWVPAPDPVQIASNCALFATVMMYFGHVAWVYVSRDLLSIIVFACSVGITLLLLVLGLWQGLRNAAADRHRQPTGPNKPEEAMAAGDSPPSARRWVLYLMLSLPCACFPANVLPHVSEMYAGGLVLPVALLAGFAAEGMCGMSRPWRVMATVLFGAQMALACAAIAAKVSELRATGDRADIMLRQLDVLVPADASNQVYAMVFLRDQIPTSGQYSIYRIADDQLLLPGLRSKWNGVLVWLRPGKELYLDTLVVDSLAEVDADAYDRVFVWDAVEARLMPIHGQP
jgi:hypothetical protein